MITGLYWGTLARQWRGLVVLLVCSGLEALPALLAGRLVEFAVDDGFAAGDAALGTAWLLVFGAVTVIGALGSRLVWQRLGTVVEPLRDTLVTAVVRGVLAGTTRHSGTPDASGVARITQHVEVVRDATGGMLVQARAKVVTSCAALVGLFSITSEIGWLVAIPVTVSVVAFVCLLPSLARRQRERVLADERTAETSGAILSGIGDVVACGAGDEAYSTVGRAVDAQRVTALRVARAGALRTLVVALGAFVPVVSVLAVTPGMVASGELSAGAALGALVYLANTMRPALQELASTTSTVLLRLLVALRRLGEVCAAPPGASTGEVPRDSAVTVRGLTHRWGPHAEPVLRDFDIDLWPGGHLAVVGPSGIGKSTLAGLLTGTLRPQAGSVRLGGVELHDVAPTVRRDTIAFTPQESYVFAGTVRENLALLAPSAGDGDLLSAAETVGALPLVRRLGGLDGTIGHSGGELSAGQAQLLALARVYASSAEVVVLDEATASLDVETEAHVERAFAARGGILVVVAHRLSSARRADRVLLLDTGQVRLGTDTSLREHATGYRALTRAASA